MHVSAVPLQCRNARACEIGAFMATTPRGILEPRTLACTSVCKKQCKTIADGVDPGKSYRISRHCDTFACSMSKNFTIGPQGDSRICESVMFINRQGRPPKGTRHEWAFAVAGHILRLPETKDECALVYLRGNGLWHGTLPTSYRHVNAGSALVTKALTIDTMRRHGQGCSHGPSWRM